MAISRVTGRMLQDNLVRDNNLAVNTDTLYIDVANNKVGINTAATGQTLTVNGNIGVGTLVLAGNSISSSGNLVLSPLGNVQVGNTYINDLADPVQNQDAATKFYVDSLAGNITFNISDGVTSQSIDNGDTITFNGTANQTQVTVSATDQVTVALANNVSIPGNLSVTGNISGANLSITGNAAIGNLETSGNLTGNNITAANAISAGTTITATGNVAGGNVTTSGTVAATTVEATGNVTAGNLVAIDLVSTANLAVSSLQSNAVVWVDTSGNLASSSNLAFDGSTLTVTGTANIDNITIDGNAITSNSGLILNTSANGNLTFNVDGTGVSQFNSTTALTVPTGNLLQRPPSPDTGAVRFNTTSLSLEVWNGFEWADVGESLTSVTTQTITGTGVTITFTLDQEATAASIIVSTNGVVQAPGVAYTVIGDQITFAEAPLSTDVIEIRFIANLSVIERLTNASGNAEIRALNDATLSTTGNIIPTANNVFSLGTTANRWSNLYLSGSTLTLGNIVITNTSGNTIAFYGPDGTTPATVDTNVTAGNVTVSGSFLQVPQYANSSLRNTAIPSPAAGMIVLVGNVFQGYNGTGWVDFNS